MLINEIREKVLDTLYQNKQKFLSRKNIIEAINLSEVDSKLFRTVIKNIVKTNLVQSLKGKLKANEEYEVGYLQAFDKDKSYIFFNKKKYLLTQAKEIDVNTIHGDKVIFEIVDKHMLIVSVISIIKRKNTKIAGTYVEYNGIGFVIPDNNKIYYDIYVIKSKLVANPYDKVLIKIDEYKVFGKPEGVIERKLFEDLDKENSYLEQVMNKYEVEVDFPTDVTKKAIALNVKIAENMLESRIDLRNENIFTIDGADAKDFDDAISVKKTENGYVLGVYIADVSYYVQENDVIDRNAFKRGTSYYLDDVCIPMLPVALSNGACSLTENENKLIVGLKMYFDNSGTLVNKEFFEGIMCSKKRFTYEEINKYLKDNNEEFHNKNINLIEDLNAAFELAQILRNNRMERGCIDFESEEVSFVKDKDKNILGFKIHARGPSNKMIEEFMLIANQTVAKTFTELRHPFIYRTHQVPFKEKVDSFLDVCKENEIDYSMINTDSMSSKQFQLLLKSLEDNRDLRRCINLNLITTMKQARYTNSPGAHFGLSIDDYCHFTSPIRRYPDLFIHRLVKKYIRKTLNNDVTIALYEKSSEIVSKHCCFTERNADRAESELNDLQIMDYMINHPQIEYNALVYSISNNGFAILVNDLFSGYVRAKVTEKTNSQLTSNNKIYKIGDRIKVYFKEYEIKNGRIIFKVVTEDDTDV